MGLDVFIIRANTHGYDPEIIRDNIDKISAWHSYRNYVQQWRKGETLVKESPYEPIGFTDWCLRYPELTESEAYDMWREYLVDYRQCKEVLRRTSTVGRPYSFKEYSGYDITDEDRELFEAFKSDYDTRYFPSDIHHYCPVHNAYEYLADYRNDWDAYKALVDVVSDGVDNGELHIITRSQLRKLGYHDFADSTDFDNQVVMYIASY